MIRDITIGQFYATESCIHKLDPRVKIIGTLIFIISLFINNYIVEYVVAGLFLAVVIHLSKVPFSYMVKGMKAIVMILLLTVIFNLFLTPGESIIQISKLSITKEGIYLSATMAVRLTYLVIGSSIMTLTTTPNHLTDGLENLLNPLNKINLPIHEISMMMSIALRFIPILLEETDKIMKAQIARGADFESKNIIKKMKSMIPLLVPLFVSAFRRAADLASAMEARCYKGGDGRTKMKPLLYQKIDYLAYIVLGVYLIVMILV